MVDPYFQITKLRKQLEHESREELRIQQWHSDEAKQMALKDKRAAFDRELSEQWKRALARSLESQEQIIEEFSEALPNLKRKYTELTPRLILY